MSVKTDRPMHPLFKKYTISDLAERTPYGEAYLVNIKLGHERATGKFRRTVSLILGEPEGDLFVSETPVEVQP